MDLEKIVKNFFEFESKNTLFKNKINHVSYWDIIRYDVFTELQNQILGDNKPYIYNKKSFVEKSLSSSLAFFRFLYQCLRFIISFFSFALLRKKYDIVFYATGGRKVIDNISINPYCFFQLKELAKSKKILVIETDLNFDRSFQKIGCDYICIPWIIMRIISLFKYLNKKERNEIANLQSLLNKSFNYVLDVKSIVKNNFSPQSLLNSIIKIILKISDPNLTVLTNNGYSKFFLKASRELGIPVIELQHGDTSEFDLVTSYPKITDGEYWVANRVFTFGDFWHDRYNFDSKIVSIGNPIFDKYTKKFNLNGNKEKSVLCISVNSVNFARLIFNASKMDHSVRFYFKLRDSEFKNWKQNYPFLSNTENFTIIDNNHRHLYFYVQICNYVVTTISTVIYEALSQTTSVIVVKDEFFSLVKRLETIGLIKVAKSEKDIIRLIKVDSAPPKVKKNFFYKPNSLVNLVREIDNILK